MLPDSLEDPFRFLVERTLSAADLPVVERIEAMRTDMAKRSGEFVGVFKGDQLEAKKGGVKSLAEVAWIVSILPLWGAFLYLCAKASESREDNSGIGRCCRDLRVLSGVVTQLYTVRDDRRKLGSCAVGGASSPPGGTACRSGHRFV